MRGLPSAGGGAHADGHKAKPAGAAASGGLKERLRRRCAGSDHGLRQLAAFVLLRHRRQWRRLDLAGLALAAELLVALLADAVGRFARRLEPLAGVELIGVLGQ